MKTILLISQVILSIIIITAGFNFISKPSDLKVFLGAAAVLIGIVLMYRPIKTLLKQL